MVQSKLPFSPGTSFAVLLGHNTPKLTSLRNVCVESRCFSGCACSSVTEPLSSMSRAQNKSADVLLLQLSQGLFAFSFIYLCACLFLCLFFFETGSQYVSEAGPELTI